MYALNAIKLHFTVFILLMQLELLCIYLNDCLLTRIVNVFLQSLLFTPFDAQTVVNYIAYILQTQNDSFTSNITKKLTRLLNL